MKIKHKSPIILAILMLVLVTLACGGGGATEEIVLTPTAEASSAQPNSPTNGDAENLNREQKSYLAHATVRILGAKSIGGELQPFYNGSGTIITSDGLILTNCHVADPVYFGFPADQGPDALIVELVSTEDKPPVPSYFATVVAKDATLDLAIIKITATLDGAQVNPSTLNLPTVPVGNSDDVSFGDPVFIFGFPGIGGDTITFSTGNVSGFDSQEMVGDRAWIKTDALIAGGNSGGLATNAKGEIIGIPSKLGTTSAQDLTDCRVIQDTNGDGVIDQNDSCVPAGGFINGIRPVNWAAGLINASQTGTTYASPYDSQYMAQQEPNQPPQKEVTGDKQFSLIGWAEQVDENYCPINPVSTFQSGATMINAVFSYSGMTPGEAYALSWFHDDREIGPFQLNWEGGNQGNCFAFYLYDEGSTLPDGNYQVEVYAGQNYNVVAYAQTNIGIGQSQNGGGQVVFQGQVTDAYNGRGIASIMVVVLYPGVDPDVWTQNVTENDIYSYAETDGNGNFTIPDALTRGQTYGVVIGNKQIGYPPYTGLLDIRQDDPNVLFIPIELSK